VRGRRSSSIFAVDTHASKYPRQDGQRSRHGGVSIVDVSADFVPVLIDHAHARMPGAAAILGGS
jgi:copper oxidase (laccase) domain-containing protein